MRARGDIAAFYRICELAVVAHVTRHVIWKLLRQHHVQVEKVGRMVLVPRSEIEKKVPRLWHGLQVVSKAHRSGQRERAQRPRDQRLSAAAPSPDRRGARGR